MTRRLLAVLLIPIVLIAAGVIDGRRDRPVRGTEAPSISAALGGFVAPVSPRTPDNAASFTPVMEGASALDGAWFCAAGSALSGSAADATVVIANSGVSAATATVQAVTDGGKTASVPVAVAGRSSARVHLADKVQGTWVAATVLVSRGQVAASLVVEHDGATVTTPCTSRASSSWYFAAGGSDNGATEDIVLYNPYPEDASVSFQLETEDGARKPPQLQGVPVPAQSVVVERVSDIERRREHLSAIVTVPVGRIVAARVLSYDGSGSAGPTKSPPKGLTVALGEPTPTTSWTWPYGTKADGHADQYVLFNPTNTDANVSVEIALAAPDQNGRLPAIPITVPAGSATVYDVAGLARVPKNLNFAVTVRSTNGVRLVAERLAEVNADGTYGIAMSPGLPIEATRWVVPTTDARQGHAYITVANPGTQPVQVRVSALVGSGGKAVAPVTIAPGDRHDFSVSAFAAGDTPAVLVEADRPVVVAALQELAKGLSMAMGIPQRGTIVFP